MATEHVDLSEQQAQFIQQRVQEGHYRDAGDVLRAGLRLLELQEREDQLKLAALRKLAREGFAQAERGEFELVEPGNLDQFMAALGDRARASVSR